jgi:hypothetical protein
MMILSALAKKSSPLEGEGWVGGTLRMNLILCICGFTPSRRAVRADLPPQGGGVEKIVSRRNCL